MSAVHSIAGADAPSLSSGPTPGLASLMPISPEARGTVQVCVVEDEDTLRESCANILRMEGYAVTVCGRGQEAQELLRRRGFDVVVVDLRMPQVDGLTLLRTALETRPDTLVIVMTGHPSLESSLEALRQGAWDYLPKPFTAAHLQVLVGRAAHAVLVARESQAQQELAAEPAGSDGPALLGTAPGFRRAVELARRVAATDASVFITGESGSGKELVAHFIHEHSRRSSRPFVAVNCAALPEPLLESEMFGHRKGAFTGAVRDKPGLLETANGGTLFLDELVEMPKAIQAKLLRVIQDGVVRRLGSETTDAVVNVRFIAATNGEPEAAIAGGALRDDLYYRLRVVPIELPPLRERAEDIPLLADHFLRASWKRHRTGQVPTLSKGALQALCGNPWRGNVREFQNVIEHVAVLAEAGSEISAEQLQLHEQPPVSYGPNPASLVATLLEESYHVARERVIAQFETQYLNWLVIRSGGNMSKAARIAGVDRTTLYRVMERLGLQRTPKSGRASGEHEAAGEEEQEPAGEAELLAPAAAAGKAVA